MAIDRSFGSFEGMLAEFENKYDSVQDKLNPTPSAFLCYNKKKDKLEICIS